jgi:hypothetical protein
MKNLQRQNMIIKLWNSISGWKIVWQEVITPKIFESHSASHNIFSNVTTVKILAGSRTVE